MSDIAASATLAPFYRPPALPRVKVGGFWGARADAVAARTADILYEHCVAAGMLEQINPDLPVPPLRIPFAPGRTLNMQMFWDSDIGKMIETAAYSLSRRPNPALEEKIDAIVEIYARLQAPDGYLNSWYQRREPEKRWTNLRDCHELYSAGHLLEGAIAYYEATGKSRLMDIMARYMDHIAARFGRGAGQARGYPGHQELELALVRLARATGESRYLELARYFIDERGQQPHFFEEEAMRRGEKTGEFHFRTQEYNQSHQPVRAQTKVVGHAVRAMYLYSAMADIAAETGDGSLTAALEALWQDLTATRLYVTGGMGASAANEGFTADYDLPNDTSYAETCASVGFTFWMQRMLGIAPDGRYGDALELAAYNGALAGMSLDGTQFFYENRLESVGDHRRWRWHECPCCPPNLARFVTAIGRYCYGEGEGGLAVHLYGESTAQLQIGGGRQVTLTQQTHYPWDGQVTLTVTPESPCHFTLSLRIPGWCRKASLCLNGAPLDLTGLTRRGYAHIEREWLPSDVLQLDLPMPVERLHAHPAVRQDAGLVALKRGPLVYCVEEVDASIEPHRLVLAPDAPVDARFEADLLGGVVSLEAVLAVEEAASGVPLYSIEAPARREASVRAVPYFAWDNRAAGGMRVWLRRG